MNAAHLHLITNHLPLAGLGMTILLHLIAVYRKSPELLKVSCWFYILIALLGILPIVTGDGAHDIVKTYPGISNDAIEYHETWGYVFFYGLIAAGVLAAGTLWFSGKKPVLARKLNIYMLIVALVTSLFAWQSGVTGGMVRHPEIEQGTFHNP